MPRFLLLGLVFASCAAPVPERGAAPPDWDVFQRHTHWRSPPVDVELDPPTATIRRSAASTNVGDVKVLVGDSSIVSTASTSLGSGYGLRMDDARQDLSRITRQVLEEEGDRFDFVAVFPTFPDRFNPGFAYYAGISNIENGYGVEMFDLAATFGSQGRLQGLLNLNRPQAYVELDGQPISDPSSAIYAIAGQELSHRWLARARFRMDGFNGGQPSPLLLGREMSHWAVTMHTGPATAQEPLFVSVQDGAAWRDNANGTFTVLDVFSDPAFSYSPRARFSPLDMYLMGLNAPEEVDPFFIILDARLAGQMVPTSARLSRGDTVTGARLDVTMDDVLAAMGPRVPDHVGARRDFTMAVVVVTMPGQQVAEVLDVVAQVDAFRVRWEETFNQWTAGRASLCTALGGQCNRTTLALEDVRVDESDVDGAWSPGETLHVRARVRNLGALPSQVATVSASTDGPALLAPAAQAVGSVAPGAAVDITLDVTPDRATRCGHTLVITLTLAASGATVTTARVSSPVGVATRARFDMEDDTVPAVVDPDGTDTATGGRWARGEPSRTDLRSVNFPQVFLQPSADADEAGTYAFVTDPGPVDLDPADGEGTDVDDGVTTLQVGPVDVQGLGAPVVTWWSWHSAVVYDAINGRVDAATGDDLVALLRFDDQAWQEIARDSTNDYAWRFHSVALNALPGSRGARAVTLRFQARDLGEEQNFVEAAIDDVAVGGTVDACVQTAASSSSSGGGSSMTPPSSAGAASSGSSSGGTGVQVPTPPPDAWGCACTGAGGGADLLVAGVGAWWLARRRRRG